MPFNPDIHKRKSIRLRGYDYSQNGAYFVTICTHNRECLFGNIANGKMQLNDTGKTIERVWNELPNHYANIKLDQSIIMPNHLHGIVVIGRGEACLAPTLGNIIGSFKSAATKQINIMRNHPGQKLWQRNYYEHIIRNEVDLNRVQQYINSNPLTWDLDSLHPNNVGGEHD